MNIEELQAYLDRYPNAQVVAIDSQKLDGFCSCPYLYGQRFNRHLKTNTPAIYLERGALIHKMLDVLYSMRKHEQNWHRNQANYGTAVQAAVKAGRTLALKSNLDIGEVQKCVDTFTEYADYWENDSWNQIIGVEQIGSKVLHAASDLIVLYEVKMDLVLKVSGQAIAVDHKTASSKREPNSLANQFKGYCFFLESNNIIINEIGLQKTLPAKDKFRRHTLSYSDAQIQEWKENTIFWAREILRAEEHNKFPRNYTSCDKYSGCDLKPLCGIDPELRSTKEDQLYHVEQWDVGKELIAKED